MPIQLLDPAIPSDLQAFISKELEADEEVIWSAQPKPVMFTGPTLGAFLFGIPWTLFALFWVAGAAGFKVPDFRNGFDLFPLFGIPFILIGFGMLSTPWWSYRSQLKTVYLITDRRAITIDGGRSLTIRSYFPSELRDIYRREHKDGTGDVIITRDAWRDSDGDRHMQELGFLRIPKARDVEKILRSFLADGAGIES